MPLQVPSVVLTIEEELKNAGKGTVMEHRASASRQGNLWMRLPEAAALCLIRVSLALIVILLMVGFSFVFGDQGNVAHAAHVNSQATRSAEDASSSLAAATALGLTASGGSGLAIPSLSIELPLSTSSTGQGITLVLKNVTIVTKKLEVELEFN
jgi:hypothetical protein